MIPSLVSPPPGSTDDEAPFAAIPARIPPPGIDVPPEDWQSSPDDWQPPSVRVDDERDPQNERQWEAREQNATELTFVPEGASQVDSFSVSGSSASGTATFIDVNAAFVALAEGTDPPEAVTGTFEISCG